MEGDEERERSLKRRDGKRERDGRKKETFSFFHLPDYDKWPGLSLVCAPPALSLGLPQTRGSFRENGPHKYCSLSQTAHSQHPSAPALITGSRQSKGAL